MHVRNLGEPKPGIQILRIGDQHSKGNSIFEGKLGRNRHTTFLACRPLGPSVVPKTINNRKKKLGSSSCSENTNQ
ncbi:hypothetical protein M569_03242, partial [Genlisea aurea]